MKIAILGTGVMGTGLAEGFINAGVETIVYNRTIEKTAPLVALGATVASTPAAAILAADATIVVMLDGAAVRSLLLNEETKTALKGKKILNAATTNYDEIEILQKEVANYGGELAECSILVGPDQLRERIGKFLLASAPDAEHFWKETLRHISDEVIYVGAIGNASKAESPMLIGSMLVSMTVAYSAAIAMKLNIPQEVIAQQLGMFIPGAEHILPNMFARDYSQVMASTENFKTVSEAAIKTANSLDIPAQPLEEILRIFDSAIQKGYGAQDGSSIIEVLLSGKGTTTIK